MLKTSVNNRIKTVLNQLRKNTFKITTAALLITAVFFGLSNIQLRSLLKNTNQQLTSKNEELKRCFNDQIMVKEKTQRGYSREEFKISSPLFEGQMVSIETLKYKDIEVKKMSIELAPSDEIPESIETTVYEFTNIPHQKLMDFYRAVSLPTESLTVGDPTYYKYTTSKGFNLRRSCRKLSISKDITTIHSIYVIISGNRCIGLEREHEERIILESTKYLEKVADTINF